MLYQVNEVLQYHQTLDEVLDRICDVLVTDMNVDRALMYVIEGNQLKLRRLAYHQRVPVSARKSLRVSMPLDPREGLTALCAVENRATNVTDPSSHEGINVELAKQIGLNPFALAPMTFRGRVLGVLGIDRSADFTAISKDEFNVLKLFARQAGQTLAAAVDSQPEVD
jgi:GAF domain-containing protein